MAFCSLVLLPDSSVSCIALDDSKKGAVGFDGGEEIQLKLTISCTRSEWTYHTTEVLSGVLCGDHRVGGIVVMDAFPRSRNTRV
ncbi:hypothetical protein TIFTF001_011253 [Ficus carica]|uniref:Uncharacterized protein n=1 Tax=Ficus carica TaxID=3494 RepID=A0AA87ZWV2_FICCA|nr:hypothetical protein TIFTF001_011253 [Ficus carica]